MRILFIADIHIKLGAKHVPKAWAASRVISLAYKVLEHSEDVGLIVVGGDLLDKSKPSVQELSLAFEFLELISKDKRVILYSGNHEATKKGFSIFQDLKQTIEKLGNIEVVTKATKFGEFNILPYEDLKTFKEGDLECTLPIFTHVRGALPPHVKPEIDLSVFAKYPIVWAGDLHNQHAQENIVYCGSPFNTSFTKERSSKGCIIIDTDHIMYEFVDFKLPFLLKNPEGQVLVGDHVITEVEGTPEELALVSGENIVKKAKHTSQAEINLKDMSIEEEVNIYLTKVMGIKDTGEILDELSNLPKAVSL